MTFRGKWLEIIFYVFVLAGAFFMLRLALGMDLYIQGTVGPGAYPMVILAGLIAVTAILLLKALRTREVRLFSHFLEGTQPDVLLRTIARIIGRARGYAVRVVTRTGVGRFSAKAAVRRAPPDGENVAVVTSETYELPNLHAAPYCLAHFEPACRLYFDPDVLVVRDDGRWRDLAAFLDDGEIRIGLAHHEGIPYSMVEWFRANGTLRLRTVFDEDPQPILRLLEAGEIDAAVVAQSALLEHGERHGLRCLGVMAENRDERLPEVPTFAELERPLYSGKWSGLALPKGTPPAVAEQWTADLRAALSHPEARSQHDGLSLPWSPLEPAEFRDFLEAQAAQRVALDPGAGTPVLPSGKTVGLLIAVAATALFPAMMSLLGFAATAFLFLTVLMALLWPTFQHRTWLFILPFAAGISFGLFLLFSRVFYVQLPEGSLTGF